MKKKFTLGVIILLIFASCSKLGKVIKSKDIDYKYSKIVEYFGKKKYNWVIQLLDEQVFPQLKGTKNFEEAYYMLAYAHFYEKDYFNAENLFRSFAETFTQSPRVEEMEYMRCYTFYKQSPKVELEQTTTQKTMNLMTQFIVRFPKSTRVADATAIIEKCQDKLEQKEVQAAQLYYDMGQYKAASVAFENILTLYPESNKGDLYKLKSIKAFYQYAEKSILDKQLERFETVVLQCEDFSDKYPESKLLSEIASIKQNTNNNIKNIKK